MPIDVFDLWESFRGNANTQQGGHVQPSRNFVNWCNQISTSLFETTFAADWEKSQKIDDDLAKPFLTTANIQVERGVVKYPPDYGHFSSARILFRKMDSAVGFMPGVKTFDKCGEEIKEDDPCPDFIGAEVWEIMKSQKAADNKFKGIKEVDDDEFGEITIDKVSNGRWGALLEHRFLSPKILSPKITQNTGGWKIAPKGVQVIILDYLRRPVPATFEYDVVPGNPITGQGDNIVYNKSASLPLEWDALIINQFLSNLEKKYGKFIRQEFLWQTSESDRKSVL